MKFITLVGILIILFCSTCAQKTIKNENLNDSSNNSLLKFKSGLKIKNGTNRGINYNDSLGIPYSIRNIPITIRNDTTLSIEIEIYFSKEYKNLITDSEKFKLIPYSMA